MILLGITFLICLSLSLLAIFYLFPKPFYELALRTQYKAAGLRREEVTLDDHKIVYLVGGKGEPLVLLHGFGADKNHWILVAKALCQHFTVYAPDLPGFGESSKDDNASYTWSDQVGRIHKFVEALGLEKFHLAGNSMGGYLAALYANRHEQQVSSLCLLAPAGVLSAEPSELATLLAAGENPLLINTREDYDRLVDMCFTQAPYVPGPFKRCICVASAENSAFFTKLFEELFNDPQAIEEALSNCPIPTLILWGDNDRILHSSGAQKLADSMPRASAQIMPRMGHIPMLERPGDTTERYLTFQKSL